MKHLLSAVALAALMAPSLFAQDALVTITAPAPNSLLGTQWVKAAEDGSLSGRVVPLHSAADLSGEVSLFAPGATEAVEAAVRPDGSFEVPGADPGLYTLVYRSEAAFATFALQVVSQESAQASATELVVAAAELAPARALSTISRYQPTTLEATESASSVDSGISAAFPIPKSLAQGSPYSVEQNSTGGLDGRLIRAGSANGGLLPAVDVNVMIIQAGEVVAQTTTSANGTFTIESLPAGSYNMIASGAAGFAALGFELVPSAQPVAGANSSSEFRLASATAQPAPGMLEAQLAPPSSLPPQGFTLEEEFVVPGPPMGDPGFAPGFAGGGFGGGGFGGGGGGGGGLLGGGGGVLGLAAVGGIIAAVIAADDDDDVRTPPASPAQP